MIIQNYFKHLASKYASDVQKHTNSYGRSLDDHLSDCWKGLLGEILEYESKLRLTAWITRREKLREARHDSSNDIDGWNVKTIHDGPSSCQTM